MGRIHRYKQEHDPVYIINLVAGKTREGRVMKTLLDKLERIRKELGRDKVFDVIGRLFEGVSLKDYMERAVTAQGADVAIFFYAGHGIAIGGTNYLLPVDADIKSEMDVKLGAAINIDLTLDQTMSDAKVKLVFLDACRDNPFAAKIRSAKATRSVSVATGLAEMKSGEGTLIAFATGPGQTARYDA